MLKHSSPTACPCGPTGPEGADLRGSTRGALSIIERGERIHLLLTDVVMPDGLDGVSLAGRARERQPDIKVLITSGYSEVAAR